MHIIILFYDYKFNLILSNLTNIISCIKICSYRLHVQLLVIYIEHIGFRLDSEIYGYSPLNACFIFYLYWEVILY